MLNAEGKYLQDSQGNPLRVKLGGDGRTIVGKLQLPSYRKKLYSFVHIIQVFELLNASGIPRCHARRLELLVPQVSTRQSEHCRTWEGFEASCGTPEYEAARITQVHLTCIRIRKDCRTEPE